MSFKIGDIVEVHGRQDAINFTGQKGKIIIDYRSLMGGYVIEAQWGVDFHGFYEDSSLHNLDGLLPYRTGYWVKEKLLTLAERKKTGFGKFISRVESA